MCDLWKHTTTQTVPPGAIPRQIDYALSQLRSRPEQIKLYNSGSFFDPAAIPPADYPAIARTVTFAKRVIVESHPRLVGEKVLRFRDLLSGSLEVAMGLETVHLQVLPRLNKKFELAHFLQAAGFLRDNGIAVRAFVLVKPPFLDEAEGLEWAVKSAVFALSCGAMVVSLIPTRPGNGALERLMETGEFSPPRLATLEKALELALEVRGDGRIFADTWDLEQFSNCPACFEKRRQRIHAMNLSQRIPPAIDCPACGLKTG
jgi:radical SAM enzyme (TIGR01210 family)